MRLRTFGLIVSSLNVIIQISTNEAAIILLADSRDASMSYILSCPPHLFNPPARPPRYPRSAAVDSNGEFALFQSRQRECCHGTPRAGNPISLTGSQTDSRELSRFRKRPWRLHTLAVELTIILGGPAFYATQIDGSVLPRGCYSVPVRWNRRGPEINAGDSCPVYSYILLRDDRPRNGRDCAAERCQPGAHASADPHRHRPAPLQSGVGPV